MCSSLQVKCYGDRDPVVASATDKAWTALNFKKSTRAMLETIQANQGDNGQFPHSKGALFLMGGVPLKDGDMVVGAVGVAGFPSGLDDDHVAQQAALKFQTILADEAAQRAP
ncbi:MAG: GlcG/HbpS family heme-binding protein [Candidatus Binataceae bacterium]